MSIVAYVGLPGSGKSYSVVEHQIVPGLRAGRKVVTNIPCNRAAMVLQPELKGELVQFDIAELEADPNRIMDYCVNGCIFIIDEVWKLWPQGLQANEVPDVYKKLLAEHRHMVDEVGNSTQIVLVVQDLANVAAFARRLVEYTYVTTKLSFVGLAKAYRVDVFHGGVTGCTPNPKRALRQLTGKYRKEIFALYKSHTMSDSAAQGANEAKMDGRANIFRRPVMLIGIVGCPLLIIWSLHVFASNFHGFAMKSQAHPVSEKAAPAPDTRAQRSGARVPASAVDSTANRPAPPPLPAARVLFAVYDQDTADQTTAYIAVGDRVEEVRGAGECRVGRHTECLWHGRWYDEVGELDQEKQVSAPVGAWSLSSPRSTGGAELVAVSGDRR